MHYLGTSCQFLLTKFGMLGVTIKFIHENQILQFKCVEQSIHIFTDFNCDRFIINIIEHDIESTVFLIHCVRVILIFSS